MDCLPNLLLHDKDVSPFKNTIFPAGTTLGESLLFEGCEETDVRQALVEMVMGRHVPPPHVTVTAAASDSPNFIKCSWGGENISVDNLQRHPPIIPQDLPILPATVTGTYHGGLSYHGSNIDSTPPLPTSQRRLSAIVSQSSNHDGLQDVLISGTSYSISETDCYHQHQQSVPARIEVIGELKMPSDIAAVRYPLQVETLTFEPCSDTSIFRASKNKTKNTIMRVSDQGAIFKACFVQIWN